MLEITYLMVIDTLDVKERISLVLFIYWLSYWYSINLAVTCTILYIKTDNYFDVFIQYHHILICSLFNFLQYLWVRGFNHNSEILIRRVPECCIWESFMLRIIVVKNVTGKIIQNGIKKYQKNRGKSILNRELVDAAVDILYNKRSKEIVSLSKHTNF